MVGRISAVRFSCVLGWIALMFGVGGCAGRTPYQIEGKYAVGDQQFQRVMGSLLGPPLVSGNTVTTLVNGKQIFPAMLEAIRSAKKTITFETFIYWSGKIGTEFSEALAERASHGVKVHLVLDGVGSGKISKEDLKRMTDAGVAVERYHLLHWYDLGSAAKLDNRTHRKLLVVDGTIGFTGGVGIADEWDGDADAKTHWRDTHYRVEGPVVAQMQSGFLDDWMETSGHVLDGEAYFPKLEGKGDTLTQMFKSSPNGGSESMQLMMLLSIASTRKQLLLSSAYFVPDAQTSKQLVAARRRGVEVKILLPGPEIDVKTVRHASRARWGPLLKEGVEIYEYMPTMFHCKLLVADGLWVSVGSSNLDNRSFQLNAEANLNVLDAKFAAEQGRIFEEDLKRSKRITYEMWKERPWVERVKEGMASLLALEL